MANDIGLGLGATASTGAVAVGGTVLLALIAGKVIIDLSHEHRKKMWKHHRPHIWHHKMNHRHIMDSIYHECVHRASHPSTVRKNRDRIFHAMHQRAPHIKELIMKGHNGVYGPHKMAEGIHNMAEDILIQFEIPQKPHESAANPRLVQAFQNHRHNDIAYRYSVPGGLVLDPYERQVLDKEILSYAGEHDGGTHHGDHVGGLVGREHERGRFEEGRLRHYFGERYFREQFRLERALAGLFPPWLLGNIAPVGPYYTPYPYPSYYPTYPTYGPDLLHPGLFPGGGLLGPWVLGGFPDRHWR